MKQGSTLGKHSQSRIGRGRSHYSEHDAHREVVQNEPVNVEAQLAYKYEDIRSCNTEELAAQMDAAAEQNLSVVMPHLFDVMGRTCQAAGTTSDAGGKPLSLSCSCPGSRRLIYRLTKKENLNYPLWS